MPKITPARRMKIWERMQGERKAKFGPVPDERKTKPQATFGNRRELIYDFICDYWEANLMSPTIREIMVEIGTSSTSAITYQTDKLIKEGRLIKPRNIWKSRQFIPTGMQIIIPGRTEVVRDKCGG